MSVGILYQDLHQKIVTATALYKEACRLADIVNYQRNMKGEPAIDIPCEQWVRTQFLSLHLTIGQVHGRKGL